MLETAMSPTTPSRPDIPPPVREKEVETPVELPDPGRELPQPDLHDENSARETKG
jgi:hypothetical protein